MYTSTALLNYSLTKFDAKKKCVFYIKGNNDNNKLKKTNNKLLVLTAVNLNKCYHKFKEKDKFKIVNNFENKVITKMQIYSTNYKRKTSIFILE